MSIFFYTGGTGAPYFFIRLHPLTHFILISEQTIQIIVALVKGAESQHVLQELLITSS